MKLDGYERELIGFAQELTAYLSKSGANWEDAKDIAQDALVKILEIETVIEPKMIRPWLFRVGLNLYFNYYKRQKNYQSILSRYFSHEPFIEEEPDYQQLYSALEQLDEKSVHLLLLKYDERLSIDEMAFVLDRPAASLKTELYRARQKLKKEIKKEAKEDGNT